MPDQILIRRVHLDCPAESAFDWHARPGALERLMPPWEPAELVSRTGGLEPGARVVLKMHLGPLPLYWHAEHGRLIPGRLFSDRQVRGPFAHWSHEHEFIPADDVSCHLEDRVTYRLPFGLFGRVFGSGIARARIDRLFDYRHDVTRHDIGAHQAVSRTPMRIAISGASGLVGRDLQAFLTTGGHTVARLARGGAATATDIAWDPTSGTIDQQRLEGVDAVVHLAGESIAAGRWNEIRKQRIRASRVDGTRLLCATLARLDRPPKVLVAASAIGFYGDRGNDTVDEQSAAAGGNDFLSGVCRDWENATQPARDAGIRVVNLRLGIVLSPRGGALAKMLLPFKLGVGGVIGSGEQSMSWIAIDDLVGVIHHALNDGELRGPVNGVAPSPVTNREFTKTLGRVLGRPTILPLPAFAARLALGEMADPLLLASTRVAPTRLSERGYQFRYPSLDRALRHLLGRTAAEGA